MKWFISVWGFLLVCNALQAATTNVGAWTPLFKGIDLASGQWVSGSSSQQVLCLRVDLTDPDIVLFTTPQCTNCGSYEVLIENTSYFLQKHGVQVAVNGGFYASSTGPTDEPVGTPETLLGLAISKGTVVSPADDATRAAAFLFATNNQALYIPTNAPSTNTTGIYTAISGNYALLRNGINLMAPNPTDLDPRTALGLSADRRHLFLLTVDGRQPGWSNGVDFRDTGEWLLRFGASDGINVDGGGSTTMAMANCVGGAVRLNRSSFVAAYGRERNIGQNFGVYARPLASDLKHLNVEPGTTTALITWHTEAPATTQVRFGPNTNYASATPLDLALKRHHVATLSGLAQGSNYYFRAISMAGGQSWTQACQFGTVTSLVRTQVFGITSVWRYTTNNLDGVNWKARTYDDGGWIGQGPGLLYIETRAEVSPKNTPLPVPIRATYYFRKHFNFAGSISGVSLILSNYVDDGAVFYLNGAEAYRPRLPAAPTTITYATAAIGVPCQGTPQQGDAYTNCPDVFVISGSVLTNLVQGDNVIAAEVHNYSTLTDVVFGSALFQNTPVVNSPRLHLWAEDKVGTLFWNGEGFTLQQTSNPGLAPSWFDVPGPVTQSPFTVTNLTTVFYRLKN